LTTVDLALNVTKSRLFGRKKALFVEINLVALIIPEIQPNLVPKPQIFGGIRGLAGELAVQTC